MHDFLSLRMGVTSRGQSTRQTHVRWPIMKQKGLCDRSNAFWFVLSWNDCFEMSLVFPSLLGVWEVWGNDMSPLVKVEVKTWSCKHCQGAETETRKWGSLWEFMTSSQINTKLNYFNPRLERRCEFPALDFFRSRPRHDRSKLLGITF